MGREQGTQLRKGSWPGRGGQEGFFGEGIMRLTPEPETGSSVNRGREYNVLGRENRVGLAGAEWCGGGAGQVAGLQPTFSWLAW